MQTNETGAFTQVPNALIDDPAIPPLEKLVLIALRRYAFGKKANAFPSQRTLARTLGTKPETVRKALQRLEAARHIERIGQKQRNVAEYAIRAVADPLGHETAQSQSPPSRQTVQSLGHETAQSLGRETAPNNTDQNKTINNTLRTDHEVDDPFGDELWDEFAYTEADHPQAPVAESRDTDPATAAPTPTSGSGAPSSGLLEAARNAEETNALERLLAEAATELGLPTDDVPDSVESVKADMERATRELGGEPFNVNGVNSLEYLLDNFGAVRCWTQAMMLRERVFSQTKPIEKPTPFLAACIQNNSPKPPHVPRAIQAQKFATLYFTGKITPEQFPRDLKPLIEAAIDDVEIPF